MGGDFFPVSDGNIQIEEKQLGTRGVVVGIGAANKTNCFFSVSNHHYIGWNLISRDRLADKEYIGWVVFYQHDQVTIRKTGAGR